MQWNDSMVKLDMAGWELSITGGFICHYRLPSNLVLLCSQMGFSSLWQFVVICLFEGGFFNGNFYISISGIIAVIL